jgi:hypothetical protein
MERMGSSELTDWMAFYEQQDRDEKKAIEKAKKDAQRNVRRR